jgi:hypothetical protein
MRKWLIAFLLGAAFLLRLSYGFTHPPVFSNADGYVDLGVSFARTGGLLDENGNPSALREPAYPILLGILFRALGEGQTTVLGANCVMGTLMLWVLFLLGRALHGEWVGLGALIIGAFYPPFIYYAGQPLRETMITLLAVLTLWSLERASRSGRMKDSLAAGIFGATTALTKTTFLPFGLILVPLGLIVNHRRRPRRAGALCACYLAVFISLYGLWPLRNWHALGKPIWGNVEGRGNNFYQYLIVPQEEGGTAGQTAILSHDPVYQKAGMTSIERDEFLWNEGIKRVRQHPWTYIKLVAWRFFWDQWRFYPRPRAYEHSYHLLRWVSLLTDGWIIPLGFAGIVLAGLRAPTGLWPVLFLFSESVVYSLIFTMIRYRLARMPVLILYACVTLNRLWLLLDSRAGSHRAGTIS